MFYRLRHSEEEVIECIVMVGDRNSFAAIHRMKGIKEETICRWVENGEKQIQRIEDQHILPYKTRRIQVDALWSFVD